MSAEQREGLSDSRRLSAAGRATGTGGAANADVESGDADPELRSDVIAWLRWSLWAGTGQGTAHDIAPRAAASDSAANLIQASV